MKQKGFTLIELLVVIAIIGLISSIALVGLNSARAKSRDAKRLSDLRQIRTALDFYYDANGTYPQYDAGGLTCSGGWALPHPSYINCWNDLQTKLTPYIAKLPQDPLNNYPPTSTFEGYDYNGTSDGSSYCVMAQVETINANQDEGCYGGNWYCLGRSC